MKQASKSAGSIRFSATRSQSSFGVPKNIRHSASGNPGGRPPNRRSRHNHRSQRPRRRSPVEAKDNECAAILAILERLSITGALVTIDAIATNPTAAKAIVDKGGDYVLALKRN